MASTPMFPFSSFSVFSFQFSVFSLEQALALLRKKTNQDRTGEVSECCQKNISGSRLGAAKTFSTSVGRMKVNVKPVARRKAQEKLKLDHCPEWYEIRREIPEAF